MAEYQEAIRLRPDYTEAHWNRARAWLLEGNFEQGWSELEWRCQRKEVAQFKRSFPQPRWDGSPLAGRTILMCQEGGFGDVIQFIRFAPLIKQRGGRVLAVCQESLIPLVASCSGIDGLVPLRPLCRLLRPCDDGESMPSVVRGLQIDTIPSLCT